MVYRVNNDCYCLPCKLTANKNAHNNNKKTLKLTEVIKNIKDT